MNRSYASWLLVCLAVFPIARAQDPDGAIEGSVTDQSESRLSAAHVTAKNLDTGFSIATLTGANGFFRIPLLPVGRYSITVEMANFATLRQEPVIVEVSQTARLELKMQVAAIKSIVTVTAEAPMVDSSSNTLGAVVTGREIVDLPLNGRNFTQLGLLQTGAAPIPAASVRPAVRCGKAKPTPSTAPGRNRTTIRLTARRT